MLIQSINHSWQMNEKLPGINICLMWRKLTNCSSCSTIYCGIHMDPMDFIILLYSINTKLTYLQWPLYISVTSILFDDKILKSSACHIHALSAKTSLLRSSIVHGYRRNVHTLSRKCSLFRLFTSAFSTWGIGQWFQGQQCMDCN